MRLSDLFEIKNGLASSSVKISEIKSEQYNVPYYRPSSSWNNLVAGYLDKNTLDIKHIYPPDTIFVSTDGDGSHSYSYVSPFEFVPNSNVAVLIPKRKMELTEKLFFAMIITKNRFRFSYGRKPKGERLASLEIPEKIFNWTKKVEIKNYEKGVTEKEYDSSIKLKDTTNWQWFRYDDIFIIKKGKRIVNSEMIQGDTPCIRPIDSNNGVYDHINLEPNHEANTITVNYNGSVAEAFYQAKSYFALDDVNILYPKFKLNPYIAMFITTLIKKEKYRFNYGRKWHLGRMNESLIKLPINKKGEPDFKFMEDYIKSLPYSKQLNQE